MATLSLLLIVVLPFVAAAGWFRGGRPERAAVAVILACWAVGQALTDVKFGRIAFGPASSDLALLAALTGLAFRYDRWWLLAVAAIQSLIVAAHLAVAIQPDLTEGENLAALTVFRLLCLLALAGGVFERWLSGEPLAAPSLHPRSKGRPAGA